MRTNELKIMVMNNKIHSEKITKEKWLMILIMQILNFLSLKKVIVRLNRRIGFSLTYFLMKMICIILFVCQIKNLRNVGIYY